MTAVDSTAPSNEAATPARSHADIAETLPYRHVTDFGRGEIGDRDLIEVIDPTTGQAWGSAPVGTPDDVDVAVAAARAALPAWAALRPSDRAEYLRRIADGIERRAEEIAHTTTLENGAPIAETGGAAMGAALLLRTVAGLAPHFEAPDVRTIDGVPVESLVRRVPYGVAGLIVPWNYPVHLVVSKLASALLAGCTVVIKPAPSTPLSVRYVLDAAVEAGLPDGAVTLVTGGNETGEALVRHPGVDKIAFTGSTAAGRRIAAICGELLRPVTLELGGKSASVVLPDADLDVVAEQLLPVSLRNTGQTCFASTRIIATRENYDRVVDVVAATVRGLRVGDPLDPATHLGPLASSIQRERVMGFVRTGIDEGARVVLGGDVPPPVEGGAFVAPTVFADVDPGARIAQEEIFGPVLTVHVAESIEHAIDIANATSYGLGGAVFGTDEDAAAAVAARIDTGTIGVNGYGGSFLAPFGGRRDSGMGAEFGIEGVSAYLATQTLHRPAH
ncbi:aldehyde dehydrogenase [Pseudoclavibacter endophyticus]|uniref:Aldehyde dehydrogenase family protein n=1 Tax=Pseudoclavibacter endophyticus TaxID=1778590 RepID=A0A6H9WTF7_9MICO|nr:aldehyde dehydrogenase family protein [Pseudoclavibacter endophyticus]KAB1649975.1 aldehyde dehydrogenase family protein [Pseudoclavibacter endophyticus]GGA58243.1 aldehyde dehydrogenase [Pseudoclavibacter endophyticus]